MLKRSRHYVSNFIRLHQCKIYKGPSVEGDNPFSENPCFLVGKIENDPFIEQTQLIHKTCVLYYGYSNS